MPARYGNTSWTGTVRPNNRAIGRLGPRRATTSLVAGLLTNQGSGKSDRQTSTYRNCFPHRQLKLPPETAGVDAMDLLVRQALRQHCNRSLSFSSKGTACRRPFRLLLPSSPVAMFPSATSRFGMTLAVARPTATATGATASAAMALVLILIAATRRYASAPALLPSLA